MMHDNELDRVFDEARQMAPSGFRDAVMHRLNETSVRIQGRWLMAAAVLILAINIWSVYSYRSTSDNSSNQTEWSYWSKHPLDEGVAHEG